MYDSIMQDMESKEWEIFFKEQKELHEKIYNETISDQEILDVKNRLASAYFYRLVCQTNFVGGFNFSEHTSRYQPVFANKDEMEKFAYISCITAIAGVFDKIAKQDSSVANISALKESFGKKLYFAISTKITNRRVSVDTITRLINNPAYIFTENSAKKTAHAIFRKTFDKTENLNESIQAYNNIIKNIKKAPVPIDLKEALISSMHNKYIEQMLQEEQFSDNYIDLSDHYYDEIIHRDSNLLLKNYNNLDKSAQDMLIDSAAGFGMTMGSGLGPNLVVGPSKHATDFIDELDKILQKKIYTDIRKYAMNEQNHTYLFKNVVNNMNKKLENLNNPKMNGNMVRIK
ncbi:MAG: hypothetical protein HRT87_09645 [Legionellales bacterium]|nr:hypothetical protein [Legionellales bacterium]